MRGHPSPHPPPHGLRALATPLSRNPGSATDCGSLQRWARPPSWKRGVRIVFRGDWRPCRLVLFFIYSLVLWELKPGNRTKQPKRLLQLDAVVILCMLKTPLAIHTRKQCMLQHTQHIGLRRLWFKVTVAVTVTGHHQSYKPHPQACTTPPQPLGAYSITRVITQLTTSEKLTITSQYQSYNWHTRRAYHLRGRLRRNVRPK